jgi:hypothetical protein
LLLAWWLEVGRAWFFRAWVGSDLYGLGSGLIFTGLGWGFILLAQAFLGLKNWLNKSGLIQAQARALLHIWKNWA